MMQPLSIPEWEWHNISMDFVTSFLKTVKGCNLVLVVVDVLTKLAHFILIKINHTLQKLTEVYIEKIISLHDIPPSIISDRGLMFTLRF